MSRIGKQPIIVLDGVKVAINGQTITAEGPRGKLELEHRSEVSLEYDDEKKLIHVKRATDDRIARALLA